MKSLKNNELGQMPKILEKEIYTQNLGRHTLKIIQDLGTNVDFTFQLEDPHTNRVIRALEVTRPGVYRIYEEKDIEIMFREEIRNFEKQKI